MTWTDGEEPKLLRRAVLLIMRHPSFRLCSKDWNCLTQKGAVVCAVFIVLVVFGFCNCCYDKLFLLDSRNCLGSVFLFDLQNNLISSHGFFKVCRKWCGGLSIVLSCHVSGAYVNSKCEWSVPEWRCWSGTSKKHSDCWNAGMELSFSVKSLRNHVLSTHKILSTQHSSNPPSQQK